MSVLGYWLKIGYLPLMPSFFSEPGADAMNKSLDDAIRSEDLETIDILVRLGVTPNETTFVDVVQSGSEKVLSTLCESSVNVKKKVLSEVRKTNNSKLLKILETDSKPKLSTSSQSIFKGKENSKISKQKKPKSKQKSAEHEEQKTKF